MAVEPPFFSERLMLSAFNLSVSESDLAISSPSDPARLGWILIRKRWISAAQLQNILSEQMSEQMSEQRQSRQKMGEILLSAALITEGQLKQALREQYWRRNGYWVI
jgi:hypothetical protein